MMRYQFKNSITDRFLLWAQNYRSKEFFNALTHYTNGNVLDVGGGIFYKNVKGKEIQFKTWTTLEYSTSFRIAFNDIKFRLVIGDGSNMCFKENTFDTVINRHVLEHTYEPIKMVQEISRVLKPGGYGIIMAPWTLPVHMEPIHYYNFTYFWMKEVLEKSNFELLELRPIGGLWSSEASHLVHFLVKIVERRTKSPIDSKRTTLFYLLLPFMILYALINIPICMIFGLGDLTEEANNYLAVVKKQI